MYVLFLPSCCTSSLRSKDFVRLLPRLPVAHSLPYESTCYFDFEFVAKESKANYLWLFFHFSFLELKAWHFENQKKKQVFGHKNTTNVIKSFKNGPSKHIYCINFWKIQICNRLEFFANQGISTEHLMRQRRAAEMSGTRKISWKFSLKLRQAIGKASNSACDQIIGKIWHLFWTWIENWKSFCLFQRPRHYNQDAVLHGIYLGQTCSVKNVCFWIFL